MIFQLLPNGSPFGGWGENVNNHHKNSLSILVVCSIVQGKTPNNLTSKQ